MNKWFFFSLALVFTGLLQAGSCKNTNTVSNTPNESKLSLEENNANIITGAEQIDQYLPNLKGKRVALAVNHTSVVGNTHLADTLIALGVDIKKIFSPEHGFRGKADAGEKVNNEKDAKTGLPIVSLYGSNKKPSQEQLKDIDLIIFDIQDVGARFYTYISTMHYVMEACAEAGKKVIVLDRPNPNGYYVDGPVLKPQHKSFVGLHPIPVVHGVTVGELALMINGESWMEKNLKADLQVVKCKNYTHKSRYSLPVKPSPNLPNDLSIQLYPSLCLFEGTPISVGRGTEYPFQVAGAPVKEYGDFQFIPKSIEGMAKNPPYENKVCYGIDFRKEGKNEKLKGGFNLEYLIYFYEKTPNKETFFNNFFEKLVGNSELRKQIQDGLTEQKIRESWQQDLNTYKSIRKKYLLYPDFE